MHAAKSVPNASSRAKPSINVNRTSTSSLDNTRKNTSPPPSTTSSNSQAAPLTTTTTRTRVVFRPPSVDPPEFRAPPLSWLTGTWYFTNSTLPIWKDKRNVRITYSLDTSNSSPSIKNGMKQERLDDVVEYQEPGSDKVKAVKGREYTSPGSDTRAWDWRGKGIIKVASSHWEILGWGEDHQKLVPSADADGHAKGSTTPGQGAFWMVTYFIKTVFTPAALDFYCRSPDGLTERAVDEIKDALQALEDPELDRLMRE